MNHRFDAEPLIKDAIKAFLRDRILRDLRPRSIEYYTSELELLTRFMTAREIDRTVNITSEDLREYLLHLSQTRGPYGIHAAYRAIKAFLRWYEVEYEPAGWRNPINKISPPKLPKDPLPPADSDTIKIMLAQCDQSTFLGARDYAIILTLMDCGARSSELCSIDVDDFDYVTGGIILRAEATKNRRSRTVFVGDLTRKAIRKYLRMRKDDSPALWVKDNGQRIQRSTLRMMFKHICARAGIVPPPIHSLRRAWALTMIRARVDPERVKKLGGWSDWSVMARYLNFNDNDLKDAHDLGAPVDKGGF